MSTSWHDFLFASLDKTGLMTVDKPPLALWVQALSVRVFGFHPLSILVPQALMGVAAVALVYDLTRRHVRPCRRASSPAWRSRRPRSRSRSLATTTPTSCCPVLRRRAVVRAARARDGRTKWLVLCGVCVGLGFETKMGVALMVVPGIALAWMWISLGRVVARAA